jgi:hypothetical protein
MKNSHRTGFHVTCSSMGGQKFRDHRGSQSLETTPRHGKRFQDQNHRQGPIGSFTQCKKGGGLSTSRWGTGQEQRLLQGRLVHPGGSSFFYKDFETLLYLLPHAVTTHRYLPFVRFAKSCQNFDGSFSHITSNHPQVVRHRIFHVGTASELKLTRRKTIC